MNEHLSNCQQRLLLLLSSSSSSSLSLSSLLLLFFFLVIVVAVVAQDGKLDPRTRDRTYTIPLDDALSKLKSQSNSIMFPVFISVSPESPENVSFENKWFFLRCVGDFEDWGQSAEIRRSTLHRKRSTTIFQANEIRKRCVHAPELYPRRGSHRERKNPQTWFSCIFKVALFFSFFLFVVLHFCVNKHRIYIVNLLQWSEWINWCIEDFQHQIKPATYGS